MTAVDDQNIGAHLKWNEVMNSVEIFGMRYADKANQPTTRFSIQTPAERYSLCAIFTQLTHNV